MPLLFKDWRPLIDELACAIRMSDEDEDFRRSAISAVVRTVRNETLKSAAELVEWKADLKPGEIAKLLRELAAGIRV
jgi:hypothetical protein